MFKAKHSFESVVHELVTGLETGSIALGDFEIDFALCIAKDGHDDLQAWKLYRVLPDREAAEAGCLRVIDESGEDYLYPANRFIVLELQDSVRRRLLGMTKA